MHYATLQELMSSDVDEEQMAAIRPEDILRTVTFDEDDDEEPESDDDDEEEEEDEVIMLSKCKTR